jgi:adenylate cyclase
MPDKQSGFLNELKQRKVFRVAAAYIVLAWLALQFLDLVFENINAPDWVMQSVMAIMAIGFPIALILAWALDVSSEGVRSVPGRSRAFMFLIAGIFVASLGFIGWMIVGTDGKESQADSMASESQVGVIDSIAVLPFESFSEDRQDEYFADGLADTLLHKLAQISTLKVIARNSSFQFKGSNKDAREIGRILNIAALLEGSVQRQDNQVRVIAQLIDTSDGTHIWSSTFDGNYQNIFELQDRIAQDIMEQLQVSISERDRMLALRNGTDSPEAYDLLMRAMQTDWGTDRVSFNPDTNAALALIDQVLDIDPNYVQALLARSAVFSSALFFSTDPENERRGIAEAISAAQRAVEVAPQYAAGYAVLGWAQIRARDHVTAEKSFIKALELDPREVGAMQGLGLLKVGEDPRFALELFTQAQDLDPQNAFVYRQRYFALNALGRLDDGIAALREGIQRFPDAHILKSDLASVLTRNMGALDEAARLSSQILEEGSQSRIGLSTMISIWGAAGDADRTASWLDIFARRFPDSTRVPTDKAAILFLYGDTAAARAVLDATEEAPDFRFDRSTSIGGICLVLGDNACLEEHANKITAWLDADEALGRPNRASERYRMTAAVLSNAALPLSGRNTAELQEHLDDSENWPITGGRGNRSTGYLRVMLQSLTGNHTDAVSDLHETLAIANDGFLYRDIFRLPPDQNPLITRLSDAPEYDSWWAEYSGRREQVRGALVQLERDNVILAASDVAP